MGNGASIDNDEYYQGSMRRRDRNVNRRESGSGTRQSNASLQSRGSSWKELIREVRLSDTEKRKLRASLLGRRSACKVNIDSNGFSLQHVKICAGQVVTFITDDENEAYNIIQVIHDGQKYVPVNGGFGSNGAITNFYEQQLNMEGEYKFAIADLELPLLTVEVFPRKEIEVTITDTGFQPMIIRIDEGNVIQFTWQNCYMPRSVYEGRYDHHSGTVSRLQMERRITPTKSGIWRRLFDKTGIYYFETEGDTAEKYHMCLVHVRERQREQKVEVLDTTFSPRIMIIVEGDRVWWHWNKMKCQNKHCIYEIEPPETNHPSDKPFQPKVNGFKWSEPSQNGLLSKEFYEPGVYFYSDYNKTASADYMGTIIVKPKQREHFVEVSSSGFKPDVLHVMAGDRIWWTWPKDQLPRGSTIKEIDKQISAVGKRTTRDLPIEDNTQYRDDELRAIKFTACLDTVSPAEIGVFQYRTTNAAADSGTCSVIVQAGTKSHTVHLESNDIEPRVVPIATGDYVWWVWEQGSKDHSVVQVTHQGNIVQGGFNSGSARECPSAFLHRFTKPGVYYYKSDGIPNIFGAIVVTSTPKVHEILVSESSILPDPCHIRVNDVVAWIFEKAKTFDLCRIKKFKDLTTAFSASPVITPRKCLCRVFDKAGMAHFTSRAFFFQNHTESSAVERVSTVTIDDLNDGVTVRLDTDGFHPEYITVKKGENVLWNWKDSQKAHNVIRVNSSNSDQPLAPIEGKAAFNSGRPVERGNFVQTFDEVSTYTVISQGAPGYSGTVTVVKSSTIPTPSPNIDLRLAPGSHVVEKGHVLYLSTREPVGVIYYTTDGSAPLLHRDSTKIYNKDGIVLNKSGACIIRAVAVNNNQLQSEIITSRRIWVRGEDDEDSDQQKVQEPIPEPAWKSWSPSIKKLQTDEPGKLIIQLETPSDILPYANHYQLYLNDVSYCEPIDINQNKLTVSGLAGSGEYEIFAIVYSNDEQLQPRKSNTLEERMLAQVKSGGPLISLETTEKKDCLAIVWMSIATAQMDVDGYFVHINGQLCGNKVMPDENYDRCKVVIEDCKLGVQYRIVVKAAVDGNRMLESNELIVTLPLNTKHFKYPSPNQRQDDDDIYKEYIIISSKEVKEAAQDGNKKKKNEEKKPLPSAVVSVRKQGEHGAFVQWQMPELHDNQFRVLMHSVSVIGAEFLQQVNSQMRYAVEVDHLDRKTNGTCHSWNVGTETNCNVQGLQIGHKYRIYVTTTYLNTSPSPSVKEVQVKSESFLFELKASAVPPKLSIINAEVNQVTLRWEVVSSEEVTGYRVLVDDQPFGGTLNKSMREVTVGSLQPGHTSEMCIVAVYENENLKSNTVSVVCPRKPQQPQIAQKASVERGKVTISWNHDPNDHVTLYRIFVDGQLYHELVPSDNKCVYTFLDMNPGQQYQISVQAVCGQKKPQNGSATVLSYVESDNTSSIKIICPIPTSSPILRITGINEEGINIIWDTVDQVTGVTITGYQLLVNKKPYGKPLDPDVRQSYIKFDQAGETMELQILSLTKSVHAEENAVTTEPSPSIFLNLTGLVKAPINVTVTNITSSTAHITWQTDEHQQPHYSAPDNFEVIFWSEENNKQSVSATDKQCNIKGLKHNLSYKVIVVAKRSQQYVEKGSSGLSYNFDVTAKSEPITFNTATPPAPPSGLSINDTTCDSIKLSWHRLADDNQVIAIYAYATNINSATSVSQRLSPSETTAVINGLGEKTEYLLTVVIATNEYFEQLPVGNELKASKKLPRERPPAENMWLPSASIKAVTSGTDAAAELTVTRKTPTTATLEWRRPIVHGTNKLKGIRVRWVEGNLEKSQGGTAGHQLELKSDATEVTLENLKPGVLYKTVVDAIISVKTTLGVSVNDSDGHNDSDEDNEMRRIVIIPSKPIIIQTKAPCQPPELLVTGYTLNTIQLYWEKPVLCVSLGRDNEGNNQYMRLSLESYRLEVNGKPHVRLSSSAQSCTLVKCKPGKTYSVVLVALTCTEEAKKELRAKKKKSDNNDEQATNSQQWITSEEDLGYDESPSAPRTVTLPTLQNGIIQDLTAKYIPATKTFPKGDTNHSQPSGNIEMNWALQDGYDGVKEWDVEWTYPAGNEHLTVPSQNSSCQITVRRFRCKYELQLCPRLTNGKTAADLQKIDVLVPGAPDAPTIWQRSVSSNEFVIEWAEPKLYLCKLIGYQVFINGKQVGSQLASHHHKAVVPSKPGRSYEVTLVAVTSEWGNSAPSNVLYIETPGATATEEDSSHTEEKDEEEQLDEVSILLKVVKITDTSIHLDWTSHYSQDIIYYRVNWSSATQPLVREVKLSPRDHTCVIHKCCPGTNHYIQVAAITDGEQVIARSRLMTVQTSAPPTPPVIFVKSMHTKYISIAWEKPTVFGDAIVTGYKVYVNGVVGSNLTADQQTFTFTHGKWCKQYIFQVQALSTSEKLHSKLSEPLLVTWPGVTPPTLAVAPTDRGDVIKVKWSTPQCAEDMIVKHFKLLVTNEADGRQVRCLGPLHAETTETDIEKLKPGSYVAQLQVYVEGSNEVVVSEPLKLHPTLMPEAPQITVILAGLEERRDIEKVICGLINRRDRLLDLLRTPNTLSLPPVGDDERSAADVTMKLAATEGLLNDCLTAIKQYTGHLVARVTWSCTQTNPDIQVTGYKVLVDGKQYGPTVPPDIQKVQIKLSLKKKNHHLSVVAIGNLGSISAPSNVVEVVTEHFQPFSFFAYLSQIQGNRKYGERGPSYAETLHQEKRIRGAWSVSGGLQMAPSQLPTVTLMDVFRSEYVPLFPTNGARRPSVLLFWSTQCAYSVRCVSWLVKFARQHYTEYDVYAVAVCNDFDHTTKHQIVETVVENGWKEEGCINHVFNQSLYTDNNRHDTLQSSNCCELFGVIGTPIIVIIHPEEYVAWKGRYCAFDYDAFEHFLLYVLAQSLHDPVPEPDPWNTDIDKALQTLPQGKGRRRPTSGPPFETKETKSRHTKHRSQSQKLSITTRPFSASKSPYREKLAKTEPIHRKNHSKKLNAWA